MKRNLWISVLILSSFSAGFAMKSALVNENPASQTPKKVTGIGGIFFKCKEPAKMKEWYSTNLGLNMDRYGTNFEWYQGADSTKRGSTQWSVFSDKTKYFLPSTKDFMINYRVANMDYLIGELRKAGVMITDSVSTFDYGKFVHIMDPEGNKIELWEPVDSVYGKYIGARTK